MLVATVVQLKRTKSRKTLFDAVVKAIYKLISLSALGCLNLTGGCHFSNLRYVCGDSFHALQSPGVSGVEMKIYERSLQALLSSAPRSRVLARLAQIGELARRLFIFPRCFLPCYVSNAYFFMIFQCQRISWKSTAIV